LRVSKTLAEGSKHHNRRICDIVNIAEKIIF
jgi:hypothetical protein